ncbi:MULTISPECIES: Hpt domain-containing protein [unclassified Lebetimonas]|uniref:Hpt domain-containing protein n=1 Tax=unclassified Lebetimonas TaxID=2648158 RepID=UPI0004666275|nr:MULTISPECIES: Hpt domain-containing protein [unclassified Lebetimonas]
MGVKDYLYSEFDSEIVDEFLMLYDIIEDNLDLLLEELYTNPEAVNDLFRMFHNLKSATAYLKLKRISNYAHLIEDILDKVRGKEKIPKDVIEWLFDATAQIHKWYDDIENNRELSNADMSILKKLPKV